MAPGRYDFRCTLEERTRAKLQEIQELLSHQIPAGDMNAVLERLCDLALPVLRQQRYAATCRPRPRPGRRSGHPRHIPAHIQRQVWERDGGRCTFVSESGGRCEERRLVQIDHTTEVARGGEATLENLRLRCWAHNQLEAERTFGSGFMRHKRITAAARREATVR